MFKYIKGFLRALNANAHPGDIAHAAAMGLLLALVPRGNLLWVLLFSLLLFVRVNKGAMFLALILLSFATPLLDGLLDSLGYAILTLQAAQPLYTSLINVPFLGLTRFNNTLVAGSLAAGIIAYGPAYFLVRFLVGLYRDKLQAKIVNSKAYKILCNLPIIKQIIAAPNLGEVIK